MKQDAFLLPWLYGLVLGLVFAGVSLACSALTDPPANWPVTSGPNPSDYPPLNDDNVIDINARRAPDAGR